MKDAVLNRLFLRYREHGDGKALAAVFDLTAKELLSVAVHLSKGAGEAEDLVQIVYLRAMERAPAFDPALRLRAWLHGILWREALSARRRAARRLEPEALARGASEDPAEQVLERELPEAVRAALAGLPQRYREVIEPLLLEDRPAHEIAARLGRSSGTVRMQIHRGLERLRRALPRGLSASGFAALPTRGWEELRRSVLRQGGISPASAGALSTCALAAQAACAAVPALWAVPLFAGGAVLVAGPPELSLLPFHEPPIAASDEPKETDPMKLSLLGLPIVLGLSSAPAQEGRVPVVAETVAGEVARLDALVADLVARSQRANGEAAVAWAGLQAAQQRIEDEQRRRAEVEWQRYRAGTELQSAWTEALSQLTDPGRRARALRELETALAAGPLERQIAACEALTRTGEVKFDKQPFRAPLQALARSSDGQLRVSALYALYNTVRSPEDLSLVLPLAGDDSPSARESFVRLLSLFSDGDLSGPAGAAALGSLEQGDVRHALGGLCGARVSPEIAERVIALSRSSDPEESYDALYHGLSTFADKTRPVVERLIEVAFDLDPNRCERALWGLGHGVPAEHGPRVAEAMRSLFEARRSPHLLTQALELVGLHGTYADAPWLRGIEVDAAQPDAVRAAARAALAAIEAR
jgi:RNA polymerase sigma factor (sigma-70 family)